MDVIVLAQEASAGGADLQEVVISAIAAVAFLIGCAGVIWARRNDRFPALDRLAGFSERVSGMPGWAALPLGIAGGSLIIAVFGFYWDVATHIDHGRDEGVFGNAAHWPILVGLLGIAIAGLVSILLGTEERRPGSWQLRPGWHVSIGGSLLLLCGSIALIGFPIDDVWHRIFGQDVTLWSPPHIQMVAGASLCTIAMWILFVEAERARPERAGHRGRLRFQEIALAGAALIGLSTLQGEFDFGVPQFRLLFQPLLIAIAAGIALVPARVRLGRGGALLAVGFFLALRGVITLVVSGVFDHVTFHLPLYLGAALVVEAVALVVPPQRQVRFGLWCGLGIGTVGLAVEAVWTQFAMPVPWTWTMLPEAAIVAIPTAIAAGLVGGFLARALAPTGTPREAAPSVLAPAALVVLVAAIAWPLPTTGVDAEAVMELEPVAGPTDGEHVEVTVTIEPPEAVADAEWLHVIAWQGASWWSEEATQIQELEPLGDGVFRTTEPVPIHGEWKAMVRIHDQRVMAAAPIFLPEDPAIPADEVPAEPQMTREFVEDHEILLREMRPAPGWVVFAANAMMALIAAAWLAAFIAGTRRLRRTADDAPPQGIDLVTEPVDAKEGTGPGAARRGG